MLGLKLLVGLPSTVRQRVALKLTPFFELVCSSVGPMLGSAWVSLQQLILLEGPFLGGHQLSRRSCDDIWRHAYVWCG